jgi:hypothetical protein
VSGHDAIPTFEEFREGARAAMDSKRANAPELRAPAPPDSRSTTGVEDETNRRADGGDLPGEVTAHLSAQAQPGRGVAPK